MAGHLASWVLPNRGVRQHEDETQEVPWRRWEQRTHDLTPAQSSDNLVAATAPPAAGSPFFECLPPEIRRKVLIEAFGDRIMHMSLEFAHPRRLVPRPTQSREPPKPQPSRVGQLIPGLSVPFRWPAIEWVAYLPPGQGARLCYQDKEAPEIWQWRGCACWSWSLPYQRDICLPGIGKCWEKDSDVPAICLVGAMGWLLTCRQAYLEGIDVLYSTNTFRLSNGSLEHNDLLVHHLSKLLSPPRLAMIRAIELRWTVDVAKLFTQETQNKEDWYFMDLVGSVPCAIPNLHRVRLSISNGSQTELIQRSRNFDRDLLAMVDSMVRNLEHLREFVLEIPQMIAQAQFSLAIEEGQKVKKVGEFNYFWRPLLRPSSPLPLSSKSQKYEKQSNDGKCVVPGYWITENRFSNPSPSGDLWHDGIVTHGLPGADF
ncbi:hypothetical protein GQ53DRAFT_805991 [Thozetella sp. PMI_491]|nr:hypothetical protein GQ53DRAFT_805991 [Thozetella sp. PMI_491]